MFSTKCSNITKTHRTRSVLTVSISSFNIHIQGLDFSDDEARNKNKKGSNKPSQESQVKQKKVRKFEAFGTYGALEGHLCSVISACTRQHLYVGTIWGRS